MNLVDEDDIAAYESAAEFICREAMSPEESRKIIAETLTAMEQA